MPEARELHKGIHTTRPELERERADNRDDGQRFVPFNPGHPEGFLDGLDSRPDPSQKALTEGHIALIASQIEKPNK